MNIKRCFQVQPRSTFESSALLFLRLTMGIAFLYHGSVKIAAPFSWMPPEAPIPGFFQFLAAIAEFGGGLALILGLLFPLALFGLLCTMLVAVSMHAFAMHDPYVNMTGGSSFEPSLGYFAVSLMFLAVGPGMFSSDIKIFGKRA